MYKTTRKAFAEFTKEADYWIEYFGLKQWELFCFHEEIEGWTDATGRYEVGHTAMYAYITMNTRFNYKPVKNEIKSCAFHEVCHILLTGLTKMGHELYSTEKVAHEAHSVIQVLVNTIFEEKRK